MADTKASELTDLSTSVAAADNLVVIDDIGGTPITKRVSITDVLALGGGNTFGRAVMTADQAVNNSTAFANATELAVALDANADYGFMVMLIYDASTVADIKTTIATLTNATGIWASSTFYTTFALGAAYNIDGGGVGTKRIDTLKGTMKVGATAGNLQVQFAQQTAEVSDTTLSIGSHLVVWKEV
jgi:hypothetical protein